MKARRAGIVLSGIEILLLIGTAIASDATPRLHLEWPESWEYRPAVERGSVVYLQARQRRDDHTVQHLRISIINTRLAQKAITPASVKDLVMQLRDATEHTPGEEQAPLRKLPNRDGYYFIAANTGGVMSSDSFKQYAEGAILHSGYLINFTLRTNDAGSAETGEMLNALDRVRIE